MFKKSLTTVCFVLVFSLASFNLGFAQESYPNAQNPIQPNWTEKVTFSVV